MGLVCAPRPHLPFRSWFHWKSHVVYIVVTKLISNSCAPPLPRPDSEKLKREPQSIGFCYLVGDEWKSTKYRGSYAQFFLRCGLDGVDLIVIPAFIFSSFKPPPPLHTGSVVFLNIGLTQTCIAIAVPPPPPPPPHMGTLPKHQEDDKEMQN